MEKLLHELMEHPTTGTGQPEKSKHHLSGFYSRKINDKHRLVYYIDEQVDSVNVLTTRSHYGNQ